MLQSGVTASIDVATVAVVKTTPFWTSVEPCFSIVAFKLWPQAQRSEPAEVRSTDSVWTCPAFSKAEARSDLLQLIAQNHPPPHGEALAPRWCVKPAQLYRALRNALPTWFRATLSERQLMCIASVATDPRLDGEQRKVLLVLALKSGPKLDRKVPQEELAALMLAEPAGRA
jgi:hypothetical protein